MIQRKLWSDCSSRLKVKRLRNFRRDADHLLATEEPVDARGNKIQSLLVLGERVVLDEGGVGHHDEARGVNLDALICAPAFFDRSRDCQGFAFVFRRIELQQRLVIRIVIGLAPVSLSPPGRAARDGCSRPRPAVS